MPSCGDRRVVVDMPNQHGKQTPAERDARTRAKQNQTSTVLDYAEANPPRGGYENAAWAKRWHEDGHPCVNCHGMHGKTVAADANFEYPDGRKLEGPPGHFNCECEIDLEEHYFSWAEKLAMQLHGDTAAAAIIERANPQGHADKLARQLMAA